MRLSGEELERGLLAWDADTPDGTAVHLFTTSGDDPTPTGNPELLDWRGPYVDPAGSIVQSPPLQYRQLRMGLHTEDPRKTPVLRDIWWETQRWTQIYRGSTIQRLQYGRRDGYVAKLVFEPAGASWDGSPVILDLANQTRVRFVNGEVFGTAITPFHTIKVEPGTGAPVMEGGRSEMTTLDGRYIEIHCTVDDDGLSFDEGVARARANCLATMGLLALVCGEQIFGPLVLEDYVHVRDDGEYGRDRIPSFLSQPRSVDDSQFDAIDRALPSAAGTNPNESPFRHGVHLALRWYVEAASTSTPFSCFMTSFLALEALATSFVAEQGAAPREDLVKFDELLASCAKKGISANKAMIATVKTILGDLPISRKFEMFRRHYSTTLGNHIDDLQVFNDARALRNRIMHGRITDLPWDQVTPLKELLERILSTVLAVPLPPPKTRVFYTDLTWSVGRPRSAPG